MFLAKVSTVPSVSVGGRKESGNNSRLDKELFLGICFATLNIKLEASTSSLMSCRCFCLVYLSTLFFILSEREDEWSRALFHSQTHHTKLIYIFKAALPRLLTIQLLHNLLLSTHKLCTIATRLLHHITFPCSGVRPSLNNLLYTQTSYNTHNHRITLPPLYTFLTSFIQYFWASYIT